MSTLVEYYYDWLRRELALDDNYVAIQEAWEQCWRGARQAARRLDNPYMAFGALRCFRILKLTGRLPAGCEPFADAVTQIDQCLGLRVPTFSEGLALLLQGVPPGDTLI